MFPSGIAQILTLPKYSLKQQTVIRIPRVFLTLVIPGVQGGSSLKRSRAECLSLHQSPWGRSERRANRCPCRASPESGWASEQKAWVNESRRSRLAGGCISLMTWKRSRLAIECDEWVGADLHNPIQTTLPPRFAQILNHQGSCDWRVIYVLLMTVDFSGLWHTHKTTLWMQIINLHLTWNACRKYSYSKYSHLSVREGNVNTRLKGNASGFRHWKHLFPHVC